MTVWSEMCVCHEVSERRTVDFLIFVQITGKKRGGSLGENVNERNETAGAVIVTVKTNSSALKPQHYNNIPE